MKSKKSQIGQIVVVFVAILVIAIMVGMTFLFTSSLKTQVQSATTVSNTIVNETGAYINQSIDSLNAPANYLLASNCQVITAYNYTSGLTISSGNYTVNSAACTWTNATSLVWNNVSVTYSFNYVKDSAYIAVNATESSGYTVVNYLPIVFLALIFAVILGVVLKIIVPYINLGQMGEGF